MDVTVSSRNFELTPALRTTTEEKIGRLSRYLDGMDRADVHFFEERNPRIADKDVCEVTLEGHGHHVRVKVAAADPFAAIDGAVDKLEHRLTKLKKRLVDRSHPRHKAAAETGFVADDDEVEGLRIVKSKRFAIKPMTPDDAALQMELLGHDFYFFSNADTGRAGIVYRRREGDVGLIDQEG
ncbi:MAG: ribosome-associated translation inhibitor RaiA [Acidobacteria bacterium]|nr:ribosome-associated translation inhibitor RaiA [Acidobacteriota bacterium]